MAGGQFGGGAGTSAAPYLVEDAADLNQIRNNLTAYYKLVSNINLGVPPYNSGKGWVPIAGFTGGFDGNAKKIYNLYINRPDEDYVGLFSGIAPVASAAAVQRAQINDLGLENVDITGRDYVGAIVGAFSYPQWNTNLNSSVYAAFLRCYVQGTVRGRNFTGGLTGQIYWGANSTTYYVNCIEDCYVDVTIAPTAAGNYFGMLAGLVRDLWMNGRGYNYFYINNCIAKGRLDTTYAVPGTTGAMCYHNQGDYMNAATCRYDKTGWTRNDVASNGNASVGLTSVEMVDVTKFSHLTSKTYAGIPLWSMLNGRVPELYFQSPDYIFVCGDNGYYTYAPGTGWTKVADTLPTRQTAIEKGMRHIEYVPQTGWDYFKNHADPYIVNIIDKADSLSIYSTPFNFTKDTANSNSSKSIFRKEIVFNSLGGNLSIINI